MNTEGTTRPKAEDIPEPIYSDDFWVDENDHEREERNALLQESPELIEILTEQMQKYGKLREMLETGEITEEEHKTQLAAIMEESDKHVEDAKKTLGKKRSESTE